MMQLSKKDLQRCRSQPVVKPACPTLVPHIDREEGLGHRSFVGNPAGAEIDYWQFNSEWGAPYRNRVNRRDRPPRFSHLVVHGGDLDEAAFPFGWPGRRDPPRGQPAAERLGRRKWGPRRGELVLAPPYPFGGADGSHLIFRWRERGSDYAVSLHAWTPLDEAEAALRETVLSIP